MKKINDRWPGLAGPDAEGQMHADNLERLVEVKFPGDRLELDQYDEYMFIVGEDPNRMTILEIHDCRPEEQQWSDQVVNVTMKAPEDQRGEILATVPVPAHFHTTSTCHPGAGEKLSLGHMPGKSWLTSAKG